MPVTNTFDAVSPTRPTLADVGSAQLINDPMRAPPHPTMMLDADKCNTWQRLLVSLGLAVPLLTIIVSNSGTTYTVTHVLSTRTTLAPANIVATRVSTGRVDLSILATPGNFNAVLPPHTSAPRAWVISGAAPLALPTTKRADAGVKTSTNAGEIWVALDNGSLTSPAAQDNSFGVVLV